MKTALIMGIYEAAWRIALPFLKRSPRLAKGFPNRCFNPPLQSADLWIQAASVGEAFLAVRLLKALHPRHRLTALVTTGTDQGLDILSSALRDFSGPSSRISVACGYFPFDRPALMEKAVAHIRPRLVVFIETEIWPGLLYAIKRHGVKSLIVNGRLTAQSHNGYRWLSGLLSILSMDRILAVSTGDASRFSALFGKNRVRLMPNMKFDDIPADTPSSPPPGFLGSLSCPLIVLGSIREEEETSVIQLLLRLREKLPFAVIALFPRHASRHAAWADALKNLDIPWGYRSAISSVPAPGSVILWDTFGELRYAYQHGDAVFVGGTLAPLGGQNFLEPLMAGVRPVIGPHWDHFNWVGEEIFSKKLVRRACDWKTAAELLIDAIENAEDRETVRSKASAYLDTRRGGTDFAARQVESLL